MKKRPTVVVSFILLFAGGGAGCSCDESTQADGNDVPGADTADWIEPWDITDGPDGWDGGDGACPESRLCGATCCDVDERCWGSTTCVPDNGTCVDDDVCINDTYCDDGICIPYGVGDRGAFNPECRTEPEPLDHFTPDIQCEWPRDDEPDLEEPAKTSVRMPPVFGDLDGDGVPEIVFSTWDGSSYGHDSIRVIRGDDCSTLWTYTGDIDCDQDIALADMDGDGLWEICSRTSTRMAFCLDHEGNLLWTGHDADGNDVRIESGTQLQVGVAIADVDGTAPPELVVGTSVFDGISGLLKLRGPDVGVAWSWSGVIPAVADIDGDGHMEAMTGGYVVDLVDELEPFVDWGTSHGYTAVAELDETSEGPEIVAVKPSASQIRVHASDGSVIWSASIPGGAGGPPTVADLDGDGRAEFSAAGNNFLTAYDLDCTADPPDPALCADPDDSDGIVWSVETHEFSSGITGSSVFDFEGDGPVEVVYADECWARVFDGRTGDVKFSAPHESGTGIEYPTIGDVDGDFYTEMVVPHERYDVCPLEDPLSPGTMRDPERAYAGITIYRDIDDAWAPSRPLWTQHTEHYSQRNNDGTVASPEVPSWLDHNSYRQTFPAGTAMDHPDLTVRDVTAPECDIDEAVQPLGATVCNRGTLPVADGVAVTFRLDASDGEVLCRAATEVDLHPGECTDVACDWTDVPMDDPHDVWAVVDDDGTGEGAVNECLEGNNLAVVESVRCPPTIL